MEPIKHWKIQGTKPFDLWTVSLFEDGHLECTCPSWSWGSKHFCKHTQNKRLELEQVFGSVSNFIKQVKDYGKEQQHL